MLGNPELERALLEQTYDGVMTVTGASKQEVGGETVVTPTRCCTRISRVRCRFRAHRTARPTRTAVRSAIRRRSTVRLIWLFRRAAALRFSSTVRPIG